MNRAVILLVCGTIALHSCKGYHGVIPVDAEEEEEAMSNEIVRQMYESVPWSALSNKSVREALHTLTEFVTSREARSLVRTFVLDIWSEREDEDDVDFLTSFLNFLGTVKPEPKVWQATHRILTFLQSSLQENYGTDLAQLPHEYDEDFLENIENFLEQNDIFTKEDQDKDDYKEYAEKVIERNGILKTYDNHKILHEKTVNENSVEEDTRATNAIPTAWTDSLSTKPAKLLLNESMNQSPEVNNIDKSSDMEIIIKVKDKPLGQINVEVKHAKEKNEEEHTPVTAQMNIHAKDKGTEKNIRGNVRVKKAKVTGAALPVHDITSIPFEERRAKDQNKEEDMAVTPPPTCPLVTEMASAGKITASAPDITHERHSVDQLPCVSQELILQDWEKVAFLSLIRAIILKEKYKLCQNSSDEISQSTLPPSPREVADQENITLPHSQTEYSLDVIANNASVPPFPGTQLTDKDRSMPTEVTPINPDTLKVNNTPDLNIFMNFFSKLIHEIPNDSVTSDHHDITTGGNDQPSTPPSLPISTEHVSNSTSTPSAGRETVSDSTPQVTNQSKDNLQELFYVLKNLPKEPFKSKGEDRGPQPSQTSSNIAAEKTNHEDVVSRIDSPGRFTGNIEPVLIYRTADLARKQKPRQHHRK